MKKHLLLTLTILCAAFIHVNSLLNADISSDQSGFVLRVVQNAAEAAGVSPQMLTEQIIRKLAHFCEYALLGVLATATIRSWRGKIKGRIYMLLFWGMAIPVSDEFLQLFVDGRAGLVQDVVLDFTGFFAGGVFCVSISFLLKRLSLMIKRRSTSTDD